MCMYMFVPADIMNRKPQQAWELYLKMETSADSFSLLQLIANDCYKVGQPVTLPHQDTLHTISLFTRWASFTMLPRPLMYWRGWIPTPSTGKGSGVRVWGFSRWWWPAMSPERASRTLCRSCAAPHSPRQNSLSWRSANGPGRTGYPYLGSDSNFSWKHCIFTHTQHSS